MENNIISSKRIAWIDVIKGIAILLVILQHCIGMVPDAGNSIVSKTILSFHMPLFFCVSGYLYKSKRDDLYFKKKVLSLFVSCLFFRILSVLIKILFYYVGLYEHVGVFNFAGFWFVESLFIVSVLFYIFEQLIGKDKKSIYVLALFFCLMIGFPYSLIVKGNENVIATSLIAMFFYICGYLFKLLFSTIELKKVVLLILVFICVTVCVFLSYLNTPVYMYISDYGKWYIFIPASLMGILSMIFLGKVIVDSKIFEFFGRNSIIILYTHFPLFRVAMTALLKFNFNACLAVLITFLFTVLMECLIISIVNRRLSFLIGKIDV